MAVFWIWVTFCTICGVFALFNIPYLRMLIVIPFVILGIVMVFALLSVITEDHGYRKNGK